MSNVSITKIFPKNLSDMNETLWANNLYSRRDMEWYTKFNRFGCIDPYNALSGAREYLFFTKPDLNLVIPDTRQLNPELKNQPYFEELINRYPDVIAQLQKSNGIGDKGPFMAILSNAVKNSLELPGITANTIDTPSNIYGTSYNYRGWGYHDDENVSFSLEFEDTKYLEVYNLIKAYEEYQRLKRLGMVTPPNIYPKAPVVNGKCFGYYLKNKILHDQFSVYKFIVEDDGETIIHYSKFWGVFFKNVPRDAFSDPKVEGGLRYAVEFEAAFVEDLNPSILTDFNELTYDYVKNTKDLPVFNKNTKMIDGTWATMPIITKVNKDKNPQWNGPDNMKYIYKLKWRK